eukprot:scaffold32116_cov92-Amphora_coffeaeformis.AAC.1
MRLSVTHKQHGHVSKLHDVRPVMGFNGQEYLGEFTCKSTSHDVGMAPGLCMRRDSYRCVP